MLSTWTILIQHWVNITLHDLGLECFGLAYLAKEISANRSFQAL